MGVGRGHWGGAGNAGDSLPCTVLQGAQDCSEDSQLERKGKHRWGCRVSGP